MIKNQIILSSHLLDLSEDISKVVKKSINEAYDTSIYDNMYKSFDELSILNNAGNIGDILQIN